MRVLVVDDEAPARQRLGGMLEAMQGCEVCGEAANGEQALVAAAAGQPDVVLMDIRMPNCDGLEATRRIKGQMPNVRVVMLTVSEDEQDLAAAVRYGADGYLLKDLLPEALFQFLRGAMSGEAPISPTMTGKLFHQLAQQGRPAAQPAASAVLSARECEVLALVVDGCSNQEIAQELSIAHNTVKNHLRSILTKLGVKNRAQAAAYAVSHGLVCLPAET